MLSRPTAQFIPIPEVEAMSENFFESAEKFANGVSQQTIGSDLFPMNETHADKRLSPAAHQDYVRHALAQNFQQGNPSSHNLHPVQLWHGPGSKGSASIGTSADGHPIPDARLTAAMKRVEGILDHSDKKAWAELLKELEKDQKSMSLSEFNALYSATQKAKESRSCVVLALPPDGPKENRMRF